MSTTPAPRLAPISEGLAFTMSLITCSLSFLPRSAQTVLSTFFVGGLFGLTLVPLSLLHGLIYLVKMHYDLPSYSILYSILLLTYVVFVNILDSTHMRPLMKGVLRVPRNVVERRSMMFWMTHFDYFPMSIHSSSGLSLSPSKQYVMGVHPHGIHCWALNLLAFPDSPLDKRFPLVSAGTMTGLAATVIFQIPVVRELFLIQGYADARRAVAQKAMENGRNLFICTGGEEESMRTVVGRDVVVLNKRKGFVRLAVAHGAALVPVFGVGISDLYTTYSFLLSLRMWLQKNTGVALPIFHGRFLSPLPYKVPLKVLVGDPIEIDPAHMPAKGEKPDPKIVDLYHRKYIEQLKEMHKEHGGGRVLEVL